MFEIVTIISIIAVPFLFASIAPVMFVKKDLGIASIVSHSSIISVCLSIAMNKWFGIDVMSSILITASVVSLIMVELYKYLREKISLTDDEGSIFLMASSFALGTLLISILFPYSLIGENMFFGAPEAISKQESIYLIVIAVIANIIFLFVRRVYYLVILDKGFANCSRGTVSIINRMMLVHSAIVLTIACYILGMVISLSLFIGAAISARRGIFSMDEFYFKYILVSLSIALYSIIISSIVMHIYGINISLSGVIALLSWMSTIV